MKNFPVTKDGKEYWISRSVAVSVFFFAHDSKGDTFVLTVQRGDNTPDPEFIGSYCVPCGYLDYEETTVQAAARELLEETGLELPEKAFNLIEVNSEPTADKRQNVVLKYLVLCTSSKEEVEGKFSTAKSEEGEVASVQFVDIKALPKHRWAFNHDLMIEKVLDDYRCLIIK